MKNSRNKNTKKNTDKKSDQKDNKKNRTTDSSPSSFKKGPPVKEPKTKEQPDRYEVDGSFRKVDPRTNKV